MDLASKFNKKKKLKAQGRNKKKADIPSNIIVVNDIQILKYNTSNFYNWHVDDGFTTPRTLSCIYFVNDNYKGGNLCFRNPDTTNEHSIEKKSNRLIIWPSSFLYPHTVKPVLEGERLSVVAWAR